MIIRLLRAALFVAAMASAGDTWARPAEPNEIALRQKFVDALKANDLTAVRSMLTEKYKIVLQENAGSPDLLKELRNQVRRCKVTKIAGAKSDYSDDYTLLFCDNNLPAGMFWKLENGKVKELEFGYLGPSAFGL